jgi:hypothetical protein
VGADLQRASPYLARQLSVREVVPTLTSRSAEIYLSILGAKQLVTLGLSWFRPGAVCLAGVCSGHYIALHRGACRAGLQAKRERRSGFQVPEVLIEASANIMVRAESEQVSAVRRPLRLGDCPSFYRPRRRHLTSALHYFVYVWRHVVQCCRVDGYPGESCFWRGVMARPVRVQERLRGWRCRGLLFSNRSCEDSRVPLT